MRLRAMTAEEFDTYRAQAIVDYAAAHVRAGTWSKETAEQESTAQYDELLPDGRETAGMLLLTAEDDGGTPVGMVWLALSHPRGRADTGFVYDIQIVPEQRRRGLGRALLAAAEQELADHDVAALALNVFGDNIVARHLYESAGYEVIAQQMRKSLS